MNCALSVACANMERTQYRAPFKASEMSTNLTDMWWCLNVRQNRNRCSTVIPRCHRTKKLKYQEKIILKKDFQNGNNNLTFYKSLKYFEKRSYISYSNSNSYFKNFTTYSSTQSKANTEIIMSNALMFTAHIQDLLHWSVIVHKQLYVSLRWMWTKSTQSAETKFWKRHYKKKWDSKRTYISCIIVLSGLITSKREKCPVIRILEDYKVFWTNQICSCAQSRPRSTGGLAS